MLNGSTLIYSLVFAAPLITVGPLADKYGRRLLFITGIVIHRWKYRQRFVSER